MIIKMDIANAFDRVRHSFLFEVMQRFGLFEKVTNSVRAYIGSPVNGQPLAFL